MANRLLNPNPQFLDDEGNPYEGGKLYFYLSTTDTPYSTYTNQALSIANANPVVLNAAGRATTGAIFLANVAYKMVLKDVDDVEIYTSDPVYSSDYSTYASVQTYNGNPNGLVAGNAATVGTLPGSSAIWDYVNNILYVCTTTGAAAVAVWTAVNGSIAATYTPPPAGYLTLTSGTPILVADTTGAAVYYTPYNGNTVPIYNGSAFTTQVFAELTLTLTSSQAASTLYDVFVFNNSGVLTLVTGPAWSSSTAGSCSRGTGAATTEINLVSGLWTNAVQIAGRNGASSYTIGANLATYLGTIFIDSSAGNVTCHLSWGQNRKWGVWNAYNRNRINLNAGDATATWLYSTATVRQSNGATGNKVTVMQGLAQDQINVSMDQNVNVVNGANFSQPSIGIGINSTTVMTGKVGLSGLITSFGSGVTFNLAAKYVQAPFLGIFNINALETGNGQATNTWQGGQEDMLLCATGMA